MRVRGLNRGDARDPRRMVAVAGTVLVVIAASALTLRPARLEAQSGHAAPHARDAVTRSYSDQAGWSLRYPRTWHLERSEQEVHLAQIEITVASFAPRRAVVVHHFRGGGNVTVVPPTERHRFPADGIALRLVDVSGAIRPDSPRNGHLHLGLRSFRPSPNVPRPRSGFDHLTGETPGGSGWPRSRARHLTLHGVLWTAVIWIGQDAPASSMLSLRQILASLAD